MPMIIDCLILLFWLLLIVQAYSTLRKRLGLPDGSASGVHVEVMLVVAWQEGEQAPTKMIEALIQSGEVARAQIVYPSELSPPHVDLENDATPCTWMPIEGSEKSLNPRATLFAGSMRLGESAEWLLFTQASVWIEPGTITKALRLAKDRQATFVTIFPSRKFGNVVVESFYPALAQWTGESVNAQDLESPEGKALAGSVDFLLIRTDTYERIRGHADVTNTIDEALALVRAARLAEFKVLALPALGAVVKPLASFRVTAKEAICRFHSILPRGRLSSVFLLLLFALVTIRPIWRTAQGWIPGGVEFPTSGIAITSFSVVALLWHRMLFHRLVGISWRGILLHPVAALLSVGILMVAVLQRVLRRGPSFERMQEKVVPACAQGVDYKTIYTERYFDGVDSIFNPWGCRDHAHYYNRVLEPLLQHISQGTALDVGCGYGYFTKRLAKHFQVDGVDISEAAVRRCKETMPDVGIRVHNIEERLPYSEKTFDLVTMTDVLEHLMRPERALLNVREVLKEGGILYVTSPNLNRLRRWFFAKADRQEHHISMLCKEDLERLIAQTGFKVIDSWTYVTAFLFPGRFRSNLGTETGIIAQKETPP